MKKNLNQTISLTPIPAVMVTAGNMEESNITTIAWTGVVNSVPPLVYVSLRPTRYSYNMIKQTGEFVINIPNDKLVWETDFCGTKSGKNIDKFKEAKLTKEEAEIVKTPIIKECPINIECKVKEIKKLGSHDMFIGEIVNVKADEDLVDEKGNIKYGEANLLTYMGDEYFVANKKIADRGICLK